MANRLYRFIHKRLYVPVTVQAFLVFITTLPLILVYMTASVYLPYSLREVSAMEEDFPWEIFYPAILMRKPAIPPTLTPANQFNIGDSIGEGEASDGVIGLAHHDNVWSTGYDGNDIVYSFNERFENRAPDLYDENNSIMDGKYNLAASGSEMDDFVAQANEVVKEADAIGKCGMVTILLGNNDVCSDSLSEMTDPVDFEAEFRAGLDVLAGSDATKNAEIHVSGIPDIYWLWVAKKDSSNCQIVWWLGSVCQVLLQNPADDCENTVSRDDPDSIYAGDGPNCQRRKEFHRRIRDVYNPILKNVTGEYKTSGLLPNAYYVDIFDVKFSASDVNDGDCFHPSTAGHDLLADEEWCRSKWNQNDPLCSP